ncbi:MAG TPA: YigZ family protein [Holophagaceae bacterium]|nr:YigZ family protein [Holophagaceae bacterium]
MRRLVAPAIHRFREKASVFLTELHPARTADERAGILAALRKRDFDATHHCSAWREGVPPGAAGSDDDGEPGGTAGPPMLRVLEGAEVSDLLAVCIRWYGGTKLGTGGLVKAYTEGVQGALAVAEAEGSLRAVVPLLHGCIACAPEQAHLPFQLLGAFPGAKILDQAFEAGNATLRFALAPEEGPRLEHLWRERSRGGSVAWEGIFADP